MKKTLSILLSLIMLATCFVFAVGAAEAEDCGCTNHIPAEVEKATCTCCLECNNINKSLLTACAHDKSNDGTFDGDLCCVNCTGIFPCGCGCSCCPTDYDDTQDTTKPILDENQQEQVVSTFQKILSRFVEWFDNLFNQIFEFLKLGEILGTGN